MTVSKLCLVTLGAALLGGLAAGLYADAAEALAATHALRRTTVVEPNESWTAVYRDLYDLYTRQYAKHKADFRSLARLADGV